MSAGWPFFPPPCCISRVNHQYFSQAKSSVFLPAPLLYFLCQSSVFLPGTIISISSRPPCCISHVNQQYLSQAQSSDFFLSLSCIFRVNHQYFSQAHSSVFLPDPCCISHVNHWYFSGSNKERERDSIAYVVMFLFPSPLCDSRQRILCKGILPQQCSTDLLFVNFRHRLHIVNEGKKKVPVINTINMW